MRGEGDGSSDVRLRVEASGDAVVAGRDVNVTQQVVIPSSIADTGHSESSFLRSYRDHVARQHGRLEPPDFARRRRVPIADIYVSPTIIPVSSRQQAGRRLSLSDLRAEIRRTVLIGDPGGGKTAATNVLMHRFATDDHGPVPFLVTLREFAMNDPPERSVAEHILHNVKVTYQCNPPAGVINQLLRTGHAVVVFDGLDELLDIALRRRAAEIIERFCSEYPNSSVLVTARAIGYDQARLDDQQFSCYRIDSFDRSQIEEYVVKWFVRGAYTDDDDEPMTDEVRQLVEAERRAVGTQTAEAFLRESDGVPELRANPMLLSLMCILYRGEGTLPRDRAEVYKQCADLLFHRWDRHRKIDPHLRADRYLDRILQHLAAEIFTDLNTPKIHTTHGRIRSLVTLRDGEHSTTRARLFVAGGELIEATEAFLLEYGFDAAEAHYAAVEFVEFSRDRMWVFSTTGVSDSGEPLYSFTHRAFLEYFGAAHMAYMCETPEHLAGALRHSIGTNKWEVLAELAVLLKDRTSAKGGERIYLELMQKNTYRDSWPSAYGSTLHFLVRCLGSLALSPRIVRLLADETIDFLCRGEKDGASIWGSPLSALLADDNYSDVVRAQAGSRTRGMLTGFDATTRAKGQRLAESLASSGVAIDG
jgi:hypothetical protein